MQEVHQVIGYVRVSTTDQAESAAGLEAQISAIKEECERRGWPDPVMVVDEGKSGATFDRPGLRKLLHRVSNSPVDRLVVAKLDRLSRSVSDFASFLSWLHEETETKLVVLDMDIDTSTASGELMGTLFVALAQWERRLIGERTKEGLAAIRARGEVISRPAVIDNPELHERIRSLRAEGKTLQEIADRLNTEGVPTLRGGTEWRPSSVASATGYRRRQRRKRNDLPLGHGQARNKPDSISEAA